MDKLDAYRNLVRKRKTCSLCGDLCNPAAVDGGLYDSEQIGPWSLWQGYLDAPLLVVGQDWGDVAYFRRWAGRDQPSGNPTNENLQRLLRTIGVAIGRPRDPQAQVVFFTNLILCLKSGGLQAPVRSQWFANCSSAFFKPLLEIVSPKVVIALGQKVSRSILDLYGIPYSRSAVFSEMLIRSPYQLTHSTVMFPVYHCGSGSVNRNRSMTHQEKDWSRIREWLSR